MKNVPLENLDRRVAELLEQQKEQEPIRLTKESKTFGLLLRTPGGMEDSEPDFVFWVDEPNGRILVIVEAKHAPNAELMDAPGQPVFGSCKGMLAVLAEDDEHLRDFEEYMK